MWCIIFSEVFSSKHIKRIGRNLLIFCWQVTPKDGSAIWHDLFSYAFWLENNIEIKFYGKVFEKFLRNFWNNFRFCVTTWYTAHLEIETTDWVVQAFNIKLIEPQMHLDKSQSLKYFRCNRSKYQKNYAIIKVKISLNHLGKIEIAKIFLVFVKHSRYFCGANKVLL